MHKVKEIKDKLLEKMEKMYSEHPDLPGSVIENIDVMAHAVKNLCKIEEYCNEEEYSSRGGSYRGSYEGEGSHRSYADGGMSNGYMPFVYGGEAYAGRRNAKRDSMGRYSREEGYSRGTWDTVDEIEDLIREAPDEQTRQKLQRIAGRMRNG